MALIGTIRKNGWILIVAMALALGGFILMDVVSNSQRYSAADVNTLGKVGDAEIKRSEFDSYQKLVYTQEAGSNTLQIRNQAWNYFLEKAIVEQQTEPLGMGIGKEELLDLQFGLNLSPIITERFKNDAGQPDRAKLANIKSAIEQGQFSEPRARAYWAVQEKEIIKTRLEEKLLNAVTKGLYTPKWQAEMIFKESNERREIRAVRVPYESVPDADVQLTDSDYEKYLDENPHLFDQDEELRTISYVSFDVVPTKADSVSTYESVAKLIEGLRTTKTDSAYVVANGGNFLGMYVPKDKFPAAFADSVSNRPIGSIIGPVYDDNEYKIIKILDRKVLPDSVRARHILLRDPTPANERAADSLITLIKSGKQRFDSLAIKISQDPGSGSKGGDLGWFSNGSMVQEFNDLCFLAGEQGKIYKVKTKFGWHIVEITGKKFIKNEASTKIALLGRRLEPSKTTQQTSKDKAVNLIQQAKSITELEAAGSQQSLRVQTSQPLKINDFNLGVTLGQGEDARDIVRWAFDKATKEGSISKEVFAIGDDKGGYFDSKYVVAAIKSIIPKGKATIATLKAMPDAQKLVRNAKKAELIIAKFKNAGDLDALSAETNVKIDTLRNTSFLQASAEPRISGLAFMLETGKVSPPVAGNLGVIVLQPISDKTTPQVPADMTMWRKQMNSQVVTTMRTNLMKSLERKANVQDNRSRFW